MSPTLEVQDCFQGSKLQIHYRSAMSNTAAGAAFEEAVAESGLPQKFFNAITRLKKALLPRIRYARPDTLASCRVVCPICQGPLRQSPASGARDARASCWIFSEPECLQLLHVPKFCQSCSINCVVTAKDGATQIVERKVRYWCGFYETPQKNDGRAYTKHLDAQFAHGDFWMLNKSFGVSFAWLRRFRYRLLVHRASFQGEATIFHLMHGHDVAPTGKYKCMH